ncbi:MAG: cupin-like domain-containing protein [Sandaracinus sp.]
MAELAREWEGWIAENLLRGASVRELVDALVDEGLARDDASERVRAIARSPILVASLPFARESRRLRTFARLDHARWAAQPSPTEVPRVAWPGLDAFYERYWAPGTPVIFTDLVTKWPAMERWSLERLEERFGDVEIRIASGREGYGRDYDVDAEKLTTATTMRDYIARIRREPETNDVYMIARNRNVKDALAGVLDDLVLPEGLFEDDLTRGSAFWLGPAGTVTPLHHDTSNILFCQVVGRKRYRMIAPLEIAVLDGARAMYAAIDPDAPDLLRFPWWEHVIVRDFVVGPGDALFIPVGWWHHVRALDVSVSLAINGFAKPNRYDWLVPARD